MQEQSVFMLVDTQHKLANWLTSDVAKDKLHDALVEVRKVNADFQKAREIDRKELVQPVTL